MKKLTLKVPRDAFQSMVYAIDKNYAMAMDTTDFESLIIATVLVEWAHETLIRDMSQEYSKPVKLKLNISQALCLRPILSIQHYDDPWLLAVYGDLSRSIDQFLQSPVRLNSTI